MGAEPMAFLLLSHGDKPMAFLLLRRGK